MTLNCCKVKFTWNFATFSCFRGNNSWTNEDRHVLSATELHPIKWTFQRLRWYRRAFTPLWGVKQLRGGETRYFRAKCVNIIRQMALTAAALLQTGRSLVCSLLSIQVELEQFSACFRVARVCQRPLDFLVSIILLFFYILLSEIFLLQL